MSAAANVHNNQVPGQSSLSSWFFRPFFQRFFGGKKENSTKHYEASFSISLKLPPNSYTLARPRLCCFESSANCLVEICQFTPCWVITCQIHQETKNKIFSLPKIM
jgi:hypothetical protein